MVNSPRAVILLGCLLSAIVLFGYPLFVDLSTSRDIASWNVEAVAAGGEAASVIRLTGTCGDLCDPGNATIYLVDPDGGYHGVGKGVLGSSSGGVWYIFHYHRPEADAPRYWITDDPEMVFTRKYIEGVEPFEPEGIWLVEIAPAGEGETVDLSVAL